MSEREDIDARRAQAVVRGLEPPAADPAFRARLRADFAAGTLVEAPDAARPARPVDVAVRRPAFGRAWRWAGALAGAAAVVAFALIAFNPGPHWQVASIQDAHGNVVVGEDAIPADDAASLTDALLPGTEIEWNGTGELVLLSPGQLALSIAPGTRMTLPAPPPRFVGRTTRARLAAGRLRITTGSDFHGARAAVITPEAEAWITGTTLAVIRDPMATCVCVSEGKVHVVQAMASGPHADLGMVPAGERQVVFRDAKTAPTRTPILPTEKDPLAELRQGMAPHWQEKSPAR